MIFNFGYCLFGGVGTTAPKPLENVIISLISWIFLSWILTCNRRGQVSSFFVLSYILKQTSICSKFSTRTKKNSSDKHVKISSHKKVAFYKKFYFKRCFCTCIIVIYFFKFKRNNNSFNLP